MHLGNKIVSLFIWTNANDGDPCQNQRERRNQLKEDKGKYENPVEDAGHKYSDPNTAQAKNAFRKPIIVLMRRSRI